MFARQSCTALAPSVTEAATDRGDQIGAGSRRRRAASITARRGRCARHPVEQSANRLPSACRTW